jgi:hypothetical protein
MDMGLIQRWMAPARARGKADQGAQDEQRRQDERRRELLRIAVHDTLAEHGIPSAWVTSEVMHAHKANRHSGWHLRLVLREWHVEFLQYMCALEKAIVARVRGVDPLAGSWLLSVCWRFELDDDRWCPPLPAAAHWEPYALGALPLADAKAALDALLHAAPQPPSAARAASATDFAPTMPMPMR